jgi:hypothetical protein
LWSCGLKKVAELRLQTFKFDFRNSVTFRSLLPVRLLSRPFSSAQDGFKNQPKIFLEMSVFLETKNLLKGTETQDFLPPTFFHEFTGFHG